MTCSDREQLTREDVSRIRRLEEEIFGRVCEIGRIMKRKENLDGVGSAAIKQFTVTPRGASELDPNVAQIEVVFKDGSAGCVKDPPGVSCNTKCEDC
ncbi:hypothetical protein DT23_13060 [Thioclava indica]|uniref:Uncharacterized protein n=1 Tax=Thioclava indica TaxID=1353528 RepID=A0A074JW21_9RHOB|nr:hypothetical protein DT23_13060 [Thioclava indica]